MKNILRKISLFVLAFLFISAVASCTVSKKEETKVNAPVFHGVEDITIEKGTQFLPLNGVTVTDEEDGNINVSLVSVNTGGINVNVEGVYTLTYTVYDSDGNKTEVQRKVSVVLIDRVAPELYGVADINVTIGDTSFTALKNVSAVDGIDGPIEVSYTGSFDIWNEGVYELHYAATDNAGNKAEALRKVTVGLGNFEFNELENIPQNGLISGGVIIESIAAYTLIKVELQVSGSGSIKPEIEGVEAKGETFEINGEQTIVLYGRLDETLEEAQTNLNMTGNVQILSAKYAFAVSADHDAPVISRSIEGAIALPTNAALDFAKSEILRGVTAFDTIDGNVTSKLTVDLENVNLAVAGNYTAVIKVSDSLDNEATLIIDVIVAEPKDTHVILDPEFNDPDVTNTQVKTTHNAGGVVVEEVKDGMYVLAIESIGSGSWASGDSPYLSGLNTTKLASGQFYMFKMDVKADKARTIQIRAGHELWGDPWIENFRDIVKYNITDEWTTIYYIFYVSKDVSRDGSNGIKFEIHCGPIYWAADEADNTVYFDNMQFYLLSNENKVPTISVVEGLPTSFGKNAELPDFTKYFQASDLEDGEIEIIPQMLDLSGVDFTTPGTYTVICTVIDSGNQQATASFEIKVLEEADTEGPVIDVPALVLQTLASYMPVSEGTSLADKFEMVFGYVTITDNVDGNIVPTMEMLDLDGLDVNSPKVGEYHVILKTKDTSGNESNSVEFVVTVKDSKAPVLVGDRNLELFVGQTFNPLTAVCGYDTNDGIIHLTTENLIGFDAVLNELGVVIAEPGEYQVSYKVSDAAGNEVEKTVVITVRAAEEFNEEHPIDLLATKQAMGSTGSSTIAYEDGIGTLDYKGVEGWYSSYIQLKYYHVHLIPNALHKLVITAKAELPREFLIYFVDSAGVKIPGFLVEETSNRLKVGLTDQYSTFEYVFIPTSEESSDSILELDWDWESFLLNTTQPNTISIKELKIVFVGEVDDPVIPEPTEYNYVSAYKDDFEQFTTNTELESFENTHWTQSKYTSQWDAMSGQMRSRAIGDTRVVNMVGGYSMTYKYTYTLDEPLENIGKVSLKLSNHWSGAQAMPIKVAVVLSDDSIVYILGSSSEFYSFHVTTGLEEFSQTFDPSEVKAFYIVTKSPKADGGYLYLDDLEFFTAVEAE